MAERHARRDQRLLEGEGASEHEGDEVVAPEALDRRDLVRLDAIAKDTVARQVGADVDVAAELAEIRVARLRDREDRAGLRVRTAEAQEIGRPVARQDRDIALHNSGRTAGGLGPPLAAADAAADLAGALAQSLVAGFGARGGHRFLR
jgi:hypothetical protein